jgi:hypothetical protein
MIWEPVLISFAIAATAAAAKVRAAKTIESRVFSRSGFRREFEKLVPPAGSKCEICGRAVTAENTKIIHILPSSGEARFICDDIDCILQYSQGSGAATVQTRLAS